MKPFTSSRESPKNLFRHLACFRDLPANADPFASHVIRLFEVAQDSLGVFLHKCCEEIAPEGEQAFSDERFLELSNYLERRRKRKWIETLRRLGVPLLQGRPAEVAGAWAWVGLNALASCAKVRTYFDSTFEQQMAVADCLRNGPESGLWLQFVSKVRGAIGIVIGDLRSSTQEEGPLADRHGNVAPARHVDTARAEGFWRDWGPVPYLVEKQRRLLHTDGCERPIRHERSHQ